MADTESRPRTLYIIDGHAQLFRAYHAIRSLASPVTGEPTNATFGFVGMLLRLFRECEPDYVVMTLDISGDRGTFRSQLYPDYKATRDVPPEDLHPQVERCTQLCNMFGVPVLSAEGFEADDVIATVCHALADEQDLQIRIISRDKDLQQLVDERTAMFDIHKDETLDQAAMESDKGIRPEQVVDMLTLMGDTVDNVPGVPGIGPKTAAKLIRQYETLDNLLAHLDDLSGKLKANIEAHQDQLSLSRELVTLRADAPVTFDLDAAAVTAQPTEALRATFRELGFNRHLRDLEALGEADTTGAQPAPPAPAEVGGLFADVAAAETGSPAPITTDGDYRAITTQAELDDLIQTLTRHVADGGVISIDTETDSVRPMLATLCGVSLAWEEKAAVYIPVRSPDAAQHLDADTVVEALRPLLEDPAVPKIGQNLKFDINVLRRAGVKMRDAAFDTMVASYLIDAARPSHRLDDLALGFLGHQMIPLTQLLGAGKHQITFDQVPLDQAVPYAAEDADITLRLRNVLAPQLKAMGLTDLLHDLEMPVVDVLAELEFNGITVDPDELDRQRDVIQKRIGELHDQVIETAGTTFNPDSPKQLADVLFNQLGCKVYKRRKTGPSTDVEVLQRIADEQPPPGSVVASLILEYRQLAKLAGTYLGALHGAIHPQTGRIHASFNQTVAATGRLSSSDPNLQNIPIRTEVGRQIRRAFVAQPGHVLLSADYSQIELRLLAHLSGDEGLSEAFEQDLDIHAAVAAEVFGVPLDQVTAEQRGSAKMVNFGIVYGITPYGLARRLAPGAEASDNVDEAKRIIDNYKQRYPRINEFLDRCVQTAETKGYVETICRRRRPIPEVNSRNGNVQALGRRMAINPVVQGSAADLIKLAMVRLQRRIESDPRPMRMLLQIHDELVFEVPIEAVETEADVARSEMTDAMDLRVPIKVDVAWAENWMESK